MSLPELTIGLVGHVDHGKTTLTKRLTGVWTDRHSEELKRGITIRLGYADATFYKCKDSKGNIFYTAQEKDKLCKGKATKVRSVSFVDAPGHETLMATMLSGASIMDGALLLVSANEDCPQPQTKEHLMALEIVGIKNIIIVQNKIDLVTEEKAIENYKQIKEFVKGTVAEKAPIIPVSAEHGTNLDVLIETIQDDIPGAESKKGAKPRMYIARSFDINKPGSDPVKMRGGVIGGALVEGALKVGDEIDIGPNRDGTFIQTKIVKLTAGGDEVKSVERGGTFGIETGLDPGLTKTDKMAGRIAGHTGTLTKSVKSINMEIHLLDRAVGSEEELEIKPLSKHEPLMLNIGTSTNVGIVQSGGKKGQYEFKLKFPACVETGSRITIARRYGSRWRLIGYGIVR